MARNLRINKRIVLLAILCLLVSSCVRSKNPLSDPDRSSVDPALLGTWIKQESGHTTEVLVVGRYGKQQEGVPAGIMVALRVSIAVDGIISSTSSTPFFVSKLGNVTYMNNFRESDISRDGTVKPWDRKNITQYQFVKYSVVGDKLEASEGIEEELAKVIERSELKGTVERKPGYAVDAKLEDSTQNLAQFFGSRKADSLFPAKTKTTYTRVANF